MNRISTKTRVFGLSDGEEITVLIQYQNVTDGQADRQTDGRTDISAVPKQRLHI